MEWIGWIWVENMNSLVWFVANNFWIGLVWLVDIQLCSWVGFTLDLKLFSGLAALDGTFPCFPHQIQINGY
jgi:hypothetical protein